MRWKRIFSMASENMKQRRLRTSLTTLGVIIGISAIIALASLGEGFRTTVKTRMEQGFELDVLTVIPGSFFAGLGNRFTEEDVQNISNIEEVAVATPVMQRSTVTLYNEDEDKNTTALIVTAINFTDFWKVFADRLIFSEGELPESIENNTMVLGYKVNHPSENITVAHPNDNVTMQFFSDKRLPKNSTFKVAGLLEKSGAPGVTNFDYCVFIPLEHAKEIYEVPSDKQDYVDLIFVKLVNSGSSETVATEIEDLLRPRFGYQLTVLVPIAFVRQVDFILNMVEIFLTSIASIALLVAGIGIMNIMTVSVMERTREIGVLKAIGAKNRTILTMFLAETILIGLVGSLVGVLSGYGFAHVLNYVLSGFFTPQQDSAFQAPETPGMSITPIFSLPWAVGAIVFGTAVCVLFGLYPARKAAKLHPVEALRYE
ncbi:ABC transporter permease [Candidatus Bathyarchaeota archaeon]|nr:ABC transporter permease [Candidatus Bathyarchaeota archaeon]